MSEHENRNLLDILRNPGGKVLLIFFKSQNESVKYSFLLFKCQLVPKCHLGFIQCSTDASQIGRAMDR